MLIAVSKMIEEVFCFRLAVLNFQGYSYLWVEPLLISLLLLMGFLPSHPCQLA